MTDADRKAIQKMTGSIQNAVAQCYKDAPGLDEEDVFSEALAEADGWKMRLEELCD